MVALSTTQFILWGIVIGLLLGLTFGLRKLILLERKIIALHGKKIK